MTKVELVPLQPDDREQFISDNQDAFLYGAIEAFGSRANCFEEDGQIIARATIEESIEEDGAEAYRIVEDGDYVGGVILKIDSITHHNELSILFVSPWADGRGVGQAAWKAIEALHPETEVWETYTPYFEKRNINFYVNKCGFHIVEYINPYHKGSKEMYNSSDDFDGMFRFEKRMR